jgi:hypothetical protein
VVKSEGKTKKLMELLKKKFFGIKDKPDPPKRTLLKIELPKCVILLSLILTEVKVT